MKCNAGLKQVKSFCGIQVAVYYSEIKIFIRNSTFRIFQDTENIKIKAYVLFRINRSNHPDLFLRKGILKICSKFKGEHPCRIEITLWHRCSPVNLLHIFGTSFYKNTSRWLLLHQLSHCSECNIINIVRVSYYMPTYFTSLCGKRGTMGNRKI